MAKLTPSVIKKRRAIANDVIAQIKARVFIATKGTYVTHDTYMGHGHGGESIEESNVTGELQKFVKARVNKANPCQVCALGSAFLSAVRLFDNFPVRKGHWGQDKMRRKLREFFTNRELGVIEASFERASIFIGKGYETDGADTPPWVNAGRVEWDQAKSYQSFLMNVDATDRLLFLMKAVANLAAERVTLKGLITQALIALATEATYADARQSIGW